MFVFYLLGFNKRLPIVKFSPTALSVIPSKYPLIIETPVFYGNLLGALFPPVPTQPDGSLSRCSSHIWIFIHLAPTLDPFFIESNLLV